MSQSGMYDAVLMDHIKNARNYRVLDEADRKASGINPLCGDEVTVYLRLGLHRVEEIAFQCSCCGISMASASIMTEIATGKPVSEVKRLRRIFADLIARDITGEGDTVNQRALAEFVRRNPIRRRCALLPWSTLDAALDGRDEANVGP